MTFLRVLAVSLVASSLIVQLSAPEGAGRAATTFAFALLILAFVAAMVAEIVGQMERSNELREAALQQAFSRDFTDRELRLAQMHLDVGQFSTRTVIATIIATLLGLLMLKRLLEKK